MDDRAATLKTLNEPIEGGNSAESQSVDRSRRKWYVIFAIIAVSAGIVLGLWFMIRQIRSHRTYENELIQKIMDTYGAYLTYNKKESMNLMEANAQFLDGSGHEEPQEDIVFILEQDVSDLPQGLASLCNEYFSEASEVKPVRVWICVPQDRTYIPVFVLYNHYETGYRDDRVVTIYDHIVTMSVQDTSKYPVGAEYHTLQSYVGIPDIRYLYIDEEAYEASVVQDDVDMDLAFGSMEYICVRGIMTIYPDHVEVSDDVHTAQMIDEPQQVTIRGTKATVELQPEDYEMIEWDEVWDFDPSQPVYDYKISIYQDSIYELQDEIGDIELITFQ